MKDPCLPGFSTKLAPLFYIDVHGSVQRAKSELKACYCSGGCMTPADTYPESSVSRSLCVREIDFFKKVRKSLGSRLSML
jgi:hypothetical protein